MQSTEADAFAEPDAPPAREPQAPPADGAPQRRRPGARSGPPHRARQRRSRPEVDGILVVDKPRGPTSHDIVHRVRCLMGVQKVGHTGTLDPMATGVLPLVMGRGTKLARYLTGGDKGYVATIALGTTTDTLDGEGQVTGEQPVRCSADEVVAAVAAMRGVTEQMPPMFSAKKVDGQKLYRLARQGTTIAREPKAVTIHEIAVTAVDLPEVTVRLRCSAGTYVRVVAEQLGQTLGCGAHLRALRRTLAGPFGEADAVPLGELERDAAAIAQHIRPLHTALVGLPQIRVPVGLARLLVSGHQLNVANLRSLDVPAFAVDDPLVIADDDGRLLAVTRALVNSKALDGARRDEQALKTERVLGR